MRSIKIGIATIGILAVVGLRPVWSSNAARTTKFKVIHAFAGGLDGANPYSELTVDPQGNLYGTTVSGGQYAFGTVFELKRTADGWKEDVLYSFRGYGNGRDGQSPEAGVIFDTAGNLYGSTALGGRHGSGTVFKLVPNVHGGWLETTIYDFGGVAGDSPNTDMIFDVMGNLYGTTPQGGGGACNPGCGVAFELIPQADGSWKEVTLHAFEGSADGVTPSSGVFLDSDGSVYGVTQHGGPGTCGRNMDAIAGCGTVYKLTPQPDGAWTETVIYTFFRGGGFARDPAGELLGEESGSLIGLSQFGGDGLGTIFELRNTQKKGWKQNILYRFHGYPDDGVEPLGRLVRDANGNLFGVAGSTGAVFELTASRHGFKEHVLYSFTGGSDGDRPSAGLVTSHGHLYGTTQYGGRSECQNGCGTVYEVTR